MLVVGSGDLKGRISVWSRETNSGEYLKKKEISAKSLGTDEIFALSSDGRHCFLGQSRGSIYSWDLLTDSLEVQFVYNLGQPMLNLAVGRGRACICATQDKTVTFIDAYGHERVGLAVLAKKQIFPTDVLRLIKLMLIAVE